jgi:DNA repair protein RecO (recombination protein O)
MVMLAKTKGIVIKQTKFSESGIVVKIYTEEYGIQSFFVRGLKSKKNRAKAVMFQPLTMLDMVINISDKKTLHHIKEVEIWYAYQSVTTNMIKRALLFFIDELLHKCLKEETENRKLFFWIHSSLVWLDLAEDGFVNFHLIFMMQLSMFMGFYPKRDDSNSNLIFDLQEGKFEKNIPPHPYYVTGKLVKSISQLHETKFEDSIKIRLDNNNRKSILETLITYYGLHVPSMGEFKSLDILTVILE